MARPGRPVAKLPITDAERAELKTRLRIGKAPADEKPRIRIVLGCAEDQSGTVIADKVRQDAPTDATHWSVCAVSRATGVSLATVQRIWHAFGLKPHLQETFKRSTDSYFVDKVHEVVGLYPAPPDPALMPWADEKSRIQALDRAQPGSLTWCGDGWPPIPAITFTSRRPPRPGSIGSSASSVSSGGAAALPSGSVGAADRRL